MSVKDLESANMRAEAGTEDGIIPDNGNGSHGHQQEEEKSTSPSLSLAQQKKLPENQNLIDFEGPNDPLNPQNLPQWKKWTFANIIGWLSFVVTFATTIFSTATLATAEEFGVSNEVMTLGTSLFIAGFAFGPLIFGPLSELYGRKRPLFAGYILFVIFQIPIGVARNIETIMLFRFLGGIASSGPLSIGGGYLADFFDPVRRGLALAILSGTSLVGPILGPIVGGFIVQSSLGWRWTAWITMIFSASVGTVGIVFLPETFGPVLLQRKARRIRFETRNWAIHAKLDESPVNLKSIATRYLQRPMIMLAIEPILQAVTLYMTFIYGFIYLLFEAYPISFVEQRGYNPGVGALPFISIGVGVVMGSGYVYYVTNTKVRRTFETTGKICPEDRLSPMMLGAILFPIGEFWYAWTSYPSISPWPQIIAGIPIGAGIQMIYLQGLAYIVDVYTINANSALSANAFVRSLVAAGFAMFATPMYNRLGVQWASSLLAFLSVAFIPVPFVLHKYGARIRKMSKYSPTL